MKPCSGTENVKASGSFRHDISYEELLEAFHTAVQLREAGRSSI